jgi:hypothetical protein
MKKTSLFICLVALALAAVVGTSAAKGPHSEHGGHGKSKGYAAKQWHAKISPTVTDGTVRGKAKADQNKKFTQLKVHLSGLVPAATYTISLNEGSCAGEVTPSLGATGSTGSTGDTGATGPSGPTGTPAATRTVVANSSGRANKNIKLRRSVLTLVTTGEYSVRVADATGANVACGDLIAKKKGHGHK